MQFITVKITKEELIMGRCADCIYYDYEGIDYKRDCYVHHWCTQFKMKVNPNATCNKFVEKATPSNSGYTGGNNNSSCFLTSACVKFMGKADDCEELTVLRKFRDEYMKSTEEGAALVKEYYAVAPQIVEKIETSVDEKKYYDGIYSVVTNCVQLIKAGKNEETLKEYKAMVENLKKELS